MNGKAMIDLAAGGCFDQLVACGLKTVSSQLKFKKLVNPLGHKATIVALIVINKINFLKECALKTSTQTAIFPHMNGLLLRVF